MSFDGNAYRKNTLARLLSEPELGDPVTGDPFLVCAVAPDADDGTAERQFDDVVTFWNKERNHPRYQGIVALLVSRKEEYARVILDGDARRKAAVRVGRERRDALDSALSVLDDLAGRLVAERGGVPRSRVAALRRIGTNHGLDSTTVDRWVSRQHVLEDPHDEPWDLPVRQQIRRVLDELGALENNAPDFTSLYSVIGLPEDAPTEVIREVTERLAKLNSGARHDRRKTLLGEVLAIIRTRLLAPDGRRRYAASLRSDAYDLILPEVETLAVVTGEISPDDHQALVAVLTGKGWGLSPLEARDIIRRAAAATGAVVRVAADAAEIIVCPSCARPQNARGEECRYCTEGLYLRCPSCRARQPAAASVCADCQASFTANREVLAEVAAARTEPPEEAEKRLTEVLRRWPDAAAAKRALGRLPLTVPSRPRAVVTTDAVELRWEPSASPGEVGYLLTREVATGQRSSQALGRISSTYFEDPDAPAGVPLRYQLTAVAGSRFSEPVWSDEVLWLREVDGVAVRTVRGAGGAPTLEIRTGSASGTGTMLVQRLDQDGAPVGVPLRADAAGVVRDTEVSGGRPYAYRVRMEYPSAGEPIRTEGHLLEGTVGRLPEPVSRLWFQTHSDGSVRLSFDAPAVGEVRIYATTGPDAAPVAAPGTDLDVDLLSRSGPRLVGTGTRRVVDRTGPGRVVYTPVTTVDGLAVAGSSLPLVVAPPVTGLTLLRDDGASVLIGFQMPIGVTEAAIRWRHDTFPSSADDPDALGTNLTNTKLEIDGGLRIPTPVDQPLYVAVYPTVRLTPSGRPVPANVTSTLVARRSQSDTGGR